MPRDRIVQVRFEDGLPITEHDTLDRYTQTSLFQIEGFNFYHTTTPASDSGDSALSPSHALTITLSEPGHLDYINDGDTVRQGYARHGDTFLWLANRPIYACWEKRLEFLTLAWESDFFARAARENVDPDRVELVGQPYLRDPLVYNIGLTLWQRSQSPGGIDKIYGETLATTLAVHTLRNYSVLKPDLHPTTPGLSKAQLRRTDAYIRDNLDQNLSLENIASVAGHSVFYFARLFKAATGKTVHQYVIERRVEKAKTLLRSGVLTIGEVAAMVGFCDQSHLHRHCKRLLGVTPAVLRAVKTERRHPTQ